MYLVITIAATIAQIGYTPSSIEWLVKSSDTVVRASVVDVSLKDQDPPSPGLYWPWKWSTVRLRVHDRLKGDPTDTIVFVVGIPNGLTTLDEWRNSKAKLIWFLDAHDPKVDRTPIPEGATADERKWRPRHGRNLGAAVLESRARVFTMDLNILDTDDAITKAIRAEASRGANARDAKSHSFTLPRAIAERTGTSGDVNSLTVPVDDRLETLARGWTTSDEAWIRRAGAESLVHFKREAHADLLQNLLRDSNATVREAAQKTLDRWQRGDFELPRDR